MGVGMGMGMGMEVAGLACAYTMLVAEVSASGSGFLSGYECFDSMREHDCRPERRIHRLSKRRNPNLPPGHDRKQCFKKREKNGPPTPAAQENKSTARHPSPSAPSAARRENLPIHALGPVIHAAHIHQATCTISPISTVPSSLTQKNQTYLHRTARTSSPPNT